MRTSPATVSVVNIRPVKTAPVEHFFVVQISVLPGRDEMWDTFTHCAAFRTEAEAQRLADRINAALDRGAFKFNWDFWVIRCGVCSPFGSNDVCYRSFLTK